MEIVAEIGTSHSGDIEKAKKMIASAAENGATVIKFQWVYANEILHPDTGFVELPGGRIPLYQKFKSLEVKKEFFEECLKYTHKCGAKFLCSPFGKQSLEELISINPDMIKIASPELNHIPLLKRAAEICKNIPIVISSGVSTLGDIEKAINTLTDGGVKKENITLLHCSTFYPTPEEEYNVKVIKNLSAVFGIKCGISDHSTDPVLIPVLNTICGGVMIEKHFTLSNETDGLDDPVALTPQKFALMCHAVKQTQAIIERYRNETNALNGASIQFTQDYIPESAFDYVVKNLSREYPMEKITACLGDGIKRLGKSERQNYGRTNRSIHYMRTMKKGEQLREQDLGILRTEKILTPGLHPDFLTRIIGAKLSRDVQNGSGVQLEDLFIKEQ
ncbi:MAG: N-acetylneuraminate synthase family protein [Treponema sp.]|nr:N-acetylneuraminate synthase family protein [Treponema sp.]